MRPRSVNVCDRGETEVNYLSWIWADDKRVCHTPAHLLLCCMFLIARGLAHVPLRCIVQKWWLKLDWMCCMCRRRRCKPVERNRRSRRRPEMTSICEQSRKTQHVGCTFCNSKQENKHTSCMSAQRKQCWNRSPRPVLNMSVVKRGRSSSKTRCWCTCSCGVETTTLAYKQRIRILIAFVCTQPIGQYGTGEHSAMVGIDRDVLHPRQHQP